MKKQNNQGTAPQGADIDMTDHEKYQAFYKQFNTVVQNHAEWLQTPQGLMEVLKDDWKGKAPIVRIDHPNEENKARDILEMIRARHANAAVQTTSQGTTP